MNKQYFNIAKINDSVGEIDIYGEIIDESWRMSDAETSAPSFKDALKELKDVKQITVNINSGGGDVFSGVAIHNMLKSHKAHVTVKIDGLAASIASVIAMAGDKVIIPRNAMLMIHNAWTFAVGNANDLRKQAEDLEKVNSVVINSYLDKNPDIDEDKLRSLMDEETWLTAQEAKDLGLVDEIAEPNKAAANITKNQIERYDNVPQKFKNEEPTVETPKETKQEVTADDVMSALDEIKSDVKAILEHVSKDETPKEDEEIDASQAQNSFARLFNMKQY
ncbi:head maturation protease, ClpP-related [Staphylococcus chromogenes]|uniref:head maturation protease, ClpP-related n=1 Tax=Staphylococcus chromogenes TaxID=46126 RepID=UPI001F1FDDA0|nr:head maturation protease, ClpP-related [Staphylococcus chromogenes]MCE4960583.1 Clp protease ClpP [Staphylococcus chromogenes]